MQPYLLGFAMVWLVRELMLPDFRPLYIHCQTGEIIQLPLQQFKGRTAYRVFVPTFQHDVIELLWAARGTRHAITALHFMQNLNVSHTYIR